MCRTFVRRLFKYLSFLAMAAMPADLTNKSFQTLAHVWLDVCM